METKTKLTITAVNSAMDLLLLSNGKTTTLEIKNLLRDLNFYATQENVHNFVEEIYLNNNSIYERYIKNEYYIYRFIQIINDEDDEDDVHVVDNIIQPGDVEREPLYIYYSINMVDPNINTVIMDDIDDDMWIAYHKDMDEEFHIYDVNLTRDLVRSKYASLLKVKIQDVRACKYSNFKIPQNV